MRIIATKPPNYEDIVAALGTPPENAIFAYDGNIYFEGCGPLPTTLIEHERVHLWRQAGDPKQWWWQYLNLPPFRLQEELVAHVREYQVYCAKHHGIEPRKRYLTAIAARMSSPMYGRMVTQRDARLAIKDMAKKLGDREAL
jgi:hypothetical protein